MRVRAGYVNDTVLPSTSAGQMVHFSGKNFGFNASEVTVTYGTRFLIYLYSLCFRTPHFQYLRHPPLVTRSVTFLPGEAADPTRYSCAVDTTRTNSTDIYCQVAAGVVSFAVSMTPSPSCLLSYLPYSHAWTGMLSLGHVASFHRERLQSPAWHRSASLCLMLIATSLVASLSSYC